MSQTPNQPRVPQGENGCNPLPSTGTTPKSLELALVKDKRDMQEVTVEGFRTLGVVSVFIASVESQCLGLAEQATSERVQEVINALLLIGLSLSSFGAVLSLFSARWFDLLTEEQRVMLEHRWAIARSRHKNRYAMSKNDPESAQNPLPSPKPVPAPEAIREHVKYYESKGNQAQRDWLVGKTIGSALIFVFCGFYTFIAGMLVYTWAVHSPITAAFNTLIAVWGTLLIAFMHLDFDFMGTLQTMSFERINVVDFLRSLRSLWGSQN